MNTFNTSVFFKVIIIKQMQSNSSDDSWWQYDQMISYSPVRVVWKVTMFLWPEVVTRMLLVFCSGKTYRLCKLLFGDGRRMQCIWGEWTEISTFRSGRGV